MNGIWVSSARLIPCNKTFTQSHESQPNPLLRYKLDTPTVLRSDLWVNMVKCLICLARKHLFFWVQTSIYVHENEIAAIKIGVLFLRQNQAFNHVHPHKSCKSYILTLLMSGNGERGKERGW